MGHNAKRTAERVAARTPLQPTMLSAAPAARLGTVPLDWRRPVATTLITTYALPGMSTARRDDTPVVRAHMGQCARCGQSARLPVGEVGAICSRCLNAEDAG